MEYLNFVLSIFFTLFFVVDPLGLIPVFASLLSNYSNREKRKIIIKATAISITISLFFIFTSKIFLNIIGITPQAFLIAGGILLFTISMDMLLARPKRTQKFSQSEDFNDISVFPLSIPLLCGPGNISALLMFSSMHGNEYHKLIIIAIISTITFLIAMIVMFLSAKLHKILGETGIEVLQKLMGLILSAMAVQFVINGILKVV